MVEFLKCAKFHWRSWEIHGPTAII